MTQTAIDTRPWCYATMIDSYSYRFVSDVTCRYAGFAGVVELQEASYGTFWAARATGDQSDNWTAAGDTPQEATRAAIAIWASMQNESNELKESETMSNELDKLNVPQPTISEELKDTLRKIATEFTLAHNPREGLCVNVECNLTTITGHRVWEVSLVYEDCATLIVQFGESERDLAHQSARCLEEGVIACYITPSQA